MKNILLFLVGLSLLAPTYPEQYVSPTEDTPCEAIEVLYDGEFNCSEVFDRQEEYEAQKRRESRIRGYQSYAVWKFTLASEAFDDYLNRVQQGAMAWKVAQCESRNDNSARPIDPATGHYLSTASGFWQFLDGTWEWVTGLPAPASAYPRSVQRAAFDKLWDNGRGSSHWNPSRYCWG